MVIPLKIWCSRGHGLLVYWGFHRATPSGKSRSSAMRPVRAPSAAPLRVQPAGSRGRDRSRPPRAPGRRSCNATGSPLPRCRRRRRSRPIDMARFGIDRGDAAFKPKLDAGLGVLTVRTQRQPILRRAAGQIILRQVRAAADCPLWCAFRTLVRHPAMSERC
jgi:hypothetical protein